MGKILIAYIPVLHAGHIELLKKHHDADAIWLLGEDVIASLGEDFDYIVKKDMLRAIPPMWVMRGIGAVPAFQNTPMQLITTGFMGSAFVPPELAVMPDEDVSRAFAEKYLGGTQVTYESVFLRYDRQAVLKQESADVAAKYSLSFSDFDRKMMRIAECESAKSADWWRQIGSVLVPLDGPLIVAHNKHILGEQMPNVLGDPRSVFKRGVHLEISTVAHSEAAVCAEAARRGIKTEDASIYVTAFPCPPCAWLISHAGISKCFFSGGYSTLEGAFILEKMGVELIYVNMTSGD